MRYQYIGLILLCTMFGSTDATTVRLSGNDARKIGQKIWYNECGGTIEGLTHWGEGEDFPSLGIGHFIWCPGNMCGAFAETFPQLRGFLAKHGKRLPKFFHGSCPWKTRKAFLAASMSKEMKLLRNFLAKTIDLQVRFIVQRFKNALPIMLRSAPSYMRRHVRREFNRVARSSIGLYALIDYVNFKGEGIKDTEDYNGYRWGLLQVLEKMQGTEIGKPALKEFARCAKKVLKERIDNAPPARNEIRWWPGWQRRIETYLS